MRAITVPSVISDPHTNVPDTAIEPNVQNGPSLAADGNADSDDDDDECMSDRCEGSERPQTPLSRVA